MVKRPSFRTFSMKPKDIIKLEKKEKKEIPEYRSKTDSKRKFVKKIKITEIEKFLKYTLDCLSAHFNNVHTAIKKTKKPTKPVSNKI